MRISECLDIKLICLTKQQPTATSNISIPESAIAIEAAVIALAKTKNQNSIRS